MLDAIGIWLSFVWAISLEIFAVLAAWCLVVRPLRRRLRGWLADRRVKRALRQEGGILYPGAGGRL